MFDLISLTTNNFRSYIGEHTFKFPTEAGLYGLQGLNLDKPRLGPNATGKSTLLEAVYWALYGTTTRGLRGQDIISWGQKSASVKLVLNVGGQASTLFRRQSPNALELDGQTCAQETITKYLRLTPKAFLYSILIPQFGDVFFDLKAAAKLELFSEVLELESWLERSKRAENLAELILEDKNQHAAKLDFLVQRCVSLEKDMDSLQELEGTFSLAVKEEIENSESKIANLNFQKAEVESTLKLDRESLTKAQSTFSTNALKLEATRDVAKKLRSDKEVLTNERARLITEHAGLDKQHKALEGLAGTCPTCLQTVHGEHKKTEIKRLVKAAGEAIFALDGVKADIIDIEELIDREDQKVAALEIKLKEINRASLALTQQVTLRLSQKNEIEGSIKSLQSEIRQARERPNPYTTLLDEKGNSLSREKNKIDTHKSKLAKLDEEQAAVSFWIKGFKRIRLSIIDETLQQLEIEVNNSLASLGLLDWRIEFDVERENKSGGITKGFVVLVHPPGQDHPIRLEAYSGGETQRLKLAGTLGLANLILHRAGLANTIEFFDEPSKHLSLEGVIDLAETLQIRAITSGKRIFLVDHQNIDFDFTGRYVATKDGNGSRLEAQP